VTRHMGDRQLAKADRTFDVVLDEVPEDVAGHLVVRDLAVKGFCVLSPGYDDRTLKCALEDIRELEFYPANSLVAEGLLGPEGSASISELESDLDDEARQEGDALKLLDRSITSVGHTIEPYIEYIGFDMTHRSNAVVHQAGEAEEGGDPRLTHEEASKWYSQFLRHRLMVLIFLGPSRGTLELEPHGVDSADTFSLTTAPGMMVLLRTDLLLHRYASASKAYVLSSFLMTPELKSYDMSNSLPVVVSLSEWTVAAMEELKKQHRRDNTELDVPRGWAHAMNHLFVTTQLVGISGLAGHYPCTYDPKALFFAASGGPDYATSVPLLRWNHDDWYDSDPEGWMRFKTCTRHAVFMEGIELFDSKFFNLSPNETRGLHPQMRSCLEVSYSAFASMGYTKGRLMNQLAGIYVAVDCEDSKAQDVPSNCHLMCMYSGRIAFSLGIKGPAVTVNNEGSSSIAALQAGADSLQAKGRSTTSASAVVVATLLVLGANHWPSFNFAGWLSKDGRCSSFNSSADGYVRGDGTGALGIKLFAEYVDGQLVCSEGDFFATIAGIQLKSNGAGASIGVSNGHGEQVCIAEALHNARISPLDVDVVGSHAVGAFLADAIELAALLRGLRGQSTSEPLPVVSVKSSLGYGIECAGMAALLNAVCAGRAGHMSPMFHLRQSNPHVDLAESPLSLVSEVFEFRWSSAFSGVMTRSNTGASGFAVLRSDRDPALLPQPSELQNEMVFWPGGGGDVEPGDRPQRRDGYYIVGSWSEWKAPQLMQARHEGTYEFSVTLGENGWEHFQIWLDGSSSRALHPDEPNAPPCTRVFGPDKHSDCGVGASALNWLVDGSADGGGPGDRYRVSLRVAGKWQLVDWERQRDEPDASPDAGGARAPLPDAGRGRYFVRASWNHWTLEEMRQAEPAPGAFTLDVRLLHSGGEFQIVRNQDMSQVIYPSNPRVSFEDAPAVLGPDGTGSGLTWFIGGDAGDNFRITFERVRQDGLDIKTVRWEQVGHAPLSEEEALRAARPVYDIIGSWDGWTVPSRMEDLGEYFRFHVQLGSAARESFQFLLNGAGDQAVHPLTRDANPHERHVIGGPGPRGHGLNWTVGAHAGDEAEVGARYEVRLNVTPSGKPWTIAWRKLGGRGRVR